MPPKRWKSAVCTCSLRPEPHTVYSKKIYAEHLRREARLRAGGRSAQPHSESRSSAEAITDSPRHSVSSELPPSTDNGSISSLEVDGTDSAQPSQEASVSISDVIMMDSNIETSAAESEPETCGSRQPPLFDMDDPAFSESESNTGSGNSTDSEAGRAHWAEAIAGINISDICDISDPDSELDDLEEVGQMKKGLVDEDIDVDSDRDSDCSDRCGKLSDENSDFNYMSKADPWTDEELLSFLLYDIKQTEKVNRRAYERFSKVCFPFSSL